jgi:hypothetical protein
MIMTSSLSTSRVLLNCDLCPDWCQAGRFAVGFVNARTGARNAFGRLGRSSCHILQAGMRYAQRGGYRPVEQHCRLRLQAAGQFARGDPISEIAHDLRVTPGSVRRLHRAWRNATLVTVAAWPSVLCSRRSVQFSWLHPVPGWADRCGSGLTVPQGLAALGWSAS